MDPATTAGVAFGATTLLAAAVAAVLFIAVLVLFFQHRSLKARLAAEAGENDRLRPYVDVADAAEEARRLRDEASAQATATRLAAEAQAQSLLAEATSQAALLRSEAQKERDAAAEEANQVRVDARAYQRDRKDKADAALSTASENATRIVAQAREQAEKIAGDALRAMRDAERWEATEKAMRNVIQGYGDRYMKPPHGVLDDLADDYDHKEAGRELKMARERSKLMVAEGRAATCDYVEKHRRETAIRFVTDAFNGKVDAILSKLRTSNIGTLTQKINDAYALVNHNGAAFRNARITPEYLNARLIELKWAQAALLLREQELEEQREIKARIREEERAQREFERAQREAAKEEAQLRKAMEKAQRMLGKAREDERAQYEAQLAELQSKLTEAEERNQRAVSMAQLTKSGHVYVISNLGSFGEDVFKIGLTRRLEPLDRVRELGDASVPFKFDVHALIYSEDAPRLETALHHRFALNQLNKVNPRKEFFRVSLHDIKAAVEELGLDVHWTLKSEALEYRETLALDAELANDESVREAWLARQARWEAYLESMGNEDDDGSDELPEGGLPPAVVAEA